MNKKGFTLVELLGVIIIIAIIITIVFPSVTKILKSSKKTIKDIQINKILDSAYDFTLKNIEFLPEEDEIKYITLNQLKKQKLIDNDIKDSTNNENFPDDLVISIQKLQSTTNQNKYYKTNGDYLYTIEIEFMDSEEYDNNRPLINFEGYEITPIVINLNIGDNYTPLEYTASSIEGVDLTNKVIENIVYKSKSVDKIDTFKPGIYYVNYTVVDSNGFSNLSTVNIIVTDNENPVLNIPSNETIGVNQTTYNLLNGVSCKDNSGDCDIKVNGTISFGVRGKYIIEYIASDSYGNTTNLKRVITIE